MRRNEEQMYVDISNKSGRTVTRNRRPRNDLLYVEVMSDQLNMGAVEDVGDEVRDWLQDKKEEIVEDDADWHDDELVSGMRKLDERVEGPSPGSNLKDFSQVKVSMRFYEEPTYDEYMAVVNEIQETLKANFGFTMVDKDIDESAWELYKCKECGQKHQKTSKIGKKHKKYAVN
jgi:hypothetical protein